MGTTEAITENFTPRGCSLEEGQLWRASLWRLRTLTDSVLVICLRCGGAAWSHWSGAGGSSAPVRKQRVLNTAIHIFIQAGNPVHEMVLPTFMLSLPTTIKPV